MFFINFWILFSFAPLYVIYKRDIQNSPSRSVKLLFFALVFMIVSIARPVLKNHFQDQKFHSEDFIIALDASYSMQADDLKPTRYVTAKRAIKTLLLSHPKDRFTLFIFTSNSLLISPPTTDTALSMVALDAINPEYILTKSTNFTALFTTVAKLPIKSKKLIIFSDGGTQHSFKRVAYISKINNITPYLVATATQEGSALKKDDHFIKDINSALVISKINPALKELAKSTAGHYYELTSIHEINELSNDLQRDVTTEATIKINSFKELFYFPLSIALALFFLATTRFNLLFSLALIFLLSPSSSKAFLLDFYHLHKAKQFVQAKKYKDAIQEYKRVEPSVSSYYNIATLYYKLGENRDALEFYTQIQTTDPKIKEALLYNMANCATRIKKYERAKLFYIQALAFGEDKDALYNLELLKRLHPKKRVSVVDMMPKEQIDKEAKNNQKNSKKQNSSNNSSSHSSSNQKSQESSHGGGSQKKKKQQAQKYSQTKNKNCNYKLGYKAYEIINKGYSNEKEPW